MMDKKQQEVLDSFFRELFTWDMTNVGLWLVTGFMELVLGVLMFVPWKELEGPLRGLAFAMSIMGANWYLMAYFQIQDGGKQCKVYEKLKYLPVSLQQIRLFRLKKLVNFCGKLTVVFLVAQLLSALIVREFSLVNILYPVFFGLLVPVVTVGGITWFAK